MSKTYHLSAKTNIQMGSVVKSIDELMLDESIVTYNTKENTFELSEIIALNKTENKISYSYIKLNNQIEAFTVNTLIYVQDEMGELFLGYFTDVKPTIESLELDLVPVTVDVHKHFNGVEWVIIKEIDAFDFEDYLYEIKVSANHSFIVENILISDY